MAEDHAGHGSGNKAHRKSTECGQRTQHGVRTGKKHLPQDQGRRGGIDVEVVEFDGRADEGCSRCATRLVRVSTHARPFCNYYSDKDPSDHSNALSLWRLCALSRSVNN
ncbi:hypothetical protein D3C87_1350370 [compost metagenome]